MNRPLGDFIHELRKAKRVTLKQAGDAIGISYVYLSEIESGNKIPSIEVIESIADYFNVSAEELLGYLRQQKVLNETTDSDDPRVIAARRVILMSEKDFSKIQRMIANIGKEDN